VSNKYLNNTNNDYNLPHYEYSLIDNEATSKLIQALAESFRKRIVKSCLF
jgi:hypothetical protein